MPRGGPGSGSSREKNTSQAQTSVNSPMSNRVKEAQAEDSGKKYKWDVKAGGSYVPQVQC